ncbi:MAG: Acetyl-CoA synthetase (ADP-forming) alpha and beta chains, putative [uncultured Acetobacteraceae bacterium]|uniref:Acetyl-CoA synthetase (ADP-forming) alpha and beta chains, putative n=1 Tax=uncultured Acetobacteraceae bacterium TaxID=169975 RepID=A0A6J4H4S5_9PROT|nr:MAG: Acetyl-CoA synthetase (ADP-forming) alpha and beta chains, putative [uncultured Acetobacteraceae bacterium]
MNPLRAALFEPRRIALIGASSDPSRLTARAQVYLRKHGFTGDILPVHPREAEVLGERAYPSVADIPGPVDLAYILLGTRQVEGVVQAVAAKGIPAACVLADGFAEAGPEGAALQDRLLSTARAAGLRLLGPNSMGVVNLSARIACSVNAALEATELPVGRLALVSQSGSMMGALLSRGAARGIGFSHLVGTGNEADLSAAEVAGLLVDDPQVDAILLFLEAVRRPDHFADLAHRAHAAGKPVIAYKLGRSPYGAELAASHTGALAGTDAAADAFFRRLGIARVSTLEGLLESPALLKSRTPLPRARRAVGVMTTTGGGGAMAVDCLGVAGVEARAPDAAAGAALEAAGFPHHVSRLLDVTLAGTKPERVAAALGALLAAEDTDLALAVIGSSAQFRPGDSVAGILLARDAARAAGNPKPVAAFLVPQADQSLRLLAEAGLAAFRTPESAADSVRAWCDWSAPRQVAPAEPVAHDLPAWPDEADARRLLAALGLPSRFAVLRSPEDDPGEVGWPVALKVLSPDLAHKTELGGVRLGITDPAALKEEAAAMRERVARLAPDARLTGFLVQPMARGLGEAILGFRRDPEVGPVVLLGTGGVTAELFRDVSLRPAPVGIEEAREMVGEVKGLRALAGWRGLPRGDLEALARAVVCLSRLAARDDVAEAEVNPAIVGPEGEGVTVADAWVVRAS